MAHIDQKRSHSMGKEAARQVAEQIAEDIGEKIGASYLWDGDRLRFERTGAKGSIEVSEEEVRVQVELGFMLRPLRSKIESKVRDYLENSLA